MKPLQGNLDFFLIITLQADSLPTELAGKPLRSTPALSSPLSPCFPHCCTRLMEGCPLGPEFVFKALVIYTETHSQIWIKHK